jgi:hypothetical protein
MTRRIVIGGIRVLAIFMLAALAVIVWFTLPQ